MAQIGFVGLGRMGGNMVARIKRDSEHEVVAFDMGAEAVAKAVEHGAVLYTSDRDFARFPGLRHVNPLRE